ncbi:MAG: Holliday junction branch migration protein RuvA [Treponema sp.]|jgi:Holliday junction DNA helicase RuvA|nr:Holliday junction branch migration protein RuvA [Treponema sp.]
MFNSIRGTVTEKLADSLRIETGGVEWDISCPALDMEAFPGPGGEGRVFTWLYHREDQMKLFGFSGERRRATFLELLKVEGVGPKGALRIMGGIGQDDLEAALENEDIGRLEAVPGLGKKTAQKMILALRGRLAAVPPAAEAASPYGELAAALAEMGYDKKQAAEALAKADAGLDPSVKGAEREQLLFKRAIVSLSGA